MILKALKCFFVFLHGMFFSDQPECFLCFFSMWELFLQGKGYCLVEAYKVWLVLQNFVGGKEVIPPACIHGMGALGDYYAGWRGLAHPLRVKDMSSVLASARSFLWVSSAGWCSQGVHGFPFLSYCPPSLGVCGSIFPFPWAVGTDKFSYLSPPLAFT